MGLSRILSVWHPVMTQSAICFSARAEQKSVPEQRHKTLAMFLLSIQLLNQNYHIIK